MEISRITEQNYNAFQYVLPSCRHPLPPLLFGCVAEGVAIGSAMLELTAEGCSLSWLWVAPEYRRKGAGSALLDVRVQVVV